MCLDFVAKMNKVAFQPINVSARISRQQIKHDITENLKYLVRIQKVDTMVICNKYSLSTRKWKGRTTIRLTDILKLGSSVD